MAGNIIYTMDPVEFRGVVLVLFSRAICNSELTTCLVRRKEVEGIEQTKKKTKKENIALSTPGTNVAYPIQTN